ncbi:MAG: hypothetical protein NTV31_00645 [Bacteroidia bacterium]|nr:hypothetical protein [Bacteroidia bacterium]
MEHTRASEALSGGSPDSRGSRHLGTLYLWWKYFLLYLKRTLNSLVLRLRCVILPSWYYIKHNSICTTGKVLRIGKIYTYKESGHVDIVRLLDVFEDGQYIYCTLYFFKENKITTVDQRLNPDDYIIWQIMEDREFDEIMSRRLWDEVNRTDELLEFDF